MSCAHQLRAGAQIGYQSMSKVWKVLFIQISCFLNGMKCQTIEINVCSDTLVETSVCSRLLLLLLLLKKKKINYTCIICYAFKKLCNWSINPTFHRKGRCFPSLFFELISTKVLWVFFVCFFFRNTQMLSIVSRIDTMRIMYFGVLQF